MKKNIYKFTTCGTYNKTCGIYFFFIFILLDSVSVNNAAIHIRSFCELSDIEYVVRQYMLFSLVRFLSSSIVQCGLRLLEFIHNT